ncbi:MAG: DUF2062 domain-containing protein [Candidatus Omnitrophica bacterium]|nr:DUF2062 domain-containing protein [Candidatus Omnitrophota bacterium]
MTTKGQTIRERWRWILQLNNSSQEIALGVALGVFISILPLYGFHTILVIIVAILIKPVNKIAILIGTNFSSILTFPFITWAGYSVGRGILGSQYPVLNWEIFRHFSYKVFFHLYYPLFVGSMLIAILAGVLFYFLILWVISKYEGRKK